SGRSSKAASSVASASSASRGSRSGTRPCCGHVRDARRQAYRRSTAARQLLDRGCRRHARRPPGQARRRRHQRGSAGPVPVVRLRGVRPRTSRIAGGRQLLRRGPDGLVPRPARHVGRDRDHAGEASRRMSAIRLRPITVADTRHLVALDDDPEAMRYLNGGLPADRRYIEEVVLPSFLASGVNEPHLGVWIVEGALHQGNDPEFLGWVSLRSGDQGEQGTAALGFRFRRVAWGRGYATEAARRVLTAAFASGTVERVVATTYQDNVASQRVLQKLGFTLVARYRPTAEELADSA